MAANDFLHAGDALGKEPLYRADMIELIAQVTGARIDSLLKDALEAQQNKNPDERRKLVDKVLSLMSDLDTLLAAHPTHRIDRWISFARKAGSGPAEADRYEVMAKRQITQWGPGKHELNEYAAKVWNGLVAGYYRTRWQAYFDAVDKGADPQKTLDQLEKNWIETVGNVPPPKPPSDPVKAARELLTRINNNQ
jgi:alpha-N-acetylglucosaminidase